MLNCTDLACVLHHHHFYAHLHHLKHHLQSENAAIGDGGDVDPNDIQGLLNDTDSELSSLSHVDAPNEVIYMVCGVIIAMILVGVVIILVAVTINKLRKRDESSSSVSNGDGIHQQSQVIPTISEQQHQQQMQQQQQQQQQQQIQQSTPISYRQNPASVWVFPPLPPQPNIYCTNSQDALIQLEKSGLKGFKRQFSGRFKRLVSRKQEPAPVIPPELKPQLKTIYVY